MAALLAQVLGVDDQAVDPREIAEPHEVERTELRAIHRHDDPVRMIHHGPLELCLDDVRDAERVLGRSAYRDESDVHGELLDRRERERCDEAAAGGAVLAAEDGRPGVGAVRADLGNADRVREHVDAARTIRTRQRMRRFAEGTRDCLSHRAAVEVDRVPVRDLVRARSGDLGLRCDVALCAVHDRPLVCHGECKRAFVGSAQGPVTVKVRDVPAGRRLSDADVLGDPQAPALVHDLEDACSAARREGWELVAPRLPGHLDEPKGCAIAIARRCAAARGASDSAVSWMTTGTGRGSEARSR